VTRFFQTLVDSLAVGSLYALIALGYTMVYGVLRFINFAHGDVFMLGAWLSYVMVRVAYGLRTPDRPHASAAWWLAPVVLVLAMAACGLIGFLIERLAYRPLRNAPRLNVLITAIGVSLLLENSGQLPFLFGTQPASMPTIVFHKAFHLAGVNIQAVDLIIIAATLILMALLQWLVFGSQTGLAMRAVSVDTSVASLMGVPVDAVVSFTFVVGSALAAAAGFLYAEKYSGLQQPAHQSWILLGVKAFVAAVVGGIGNLRGAILGGLLIALIEHFGAAYLSTNLRDVYVFSLLILALLLRPAGLLGKPLAEKV
jgi:branched-chain amino acid transport system permease protein